MNESITRAAGAAFGQELPPQAMDALIGELGRVPVSAHDALRRGAGRARRGLVPRGAARPARQPAAAAPRADQGAGAGALRIAPVAAAITLDGGARHPGDRRRRRPRARSSATRLEAAGLRPRRDDVLVVTHKVVSKAEGRLVALADVAPSARARELAAATGKDAALVEVILAESREVLRWRPGLIVTEHRLGMVLANAGVDQSNVPQTGGARASCCCRRTPTPAPRPCAKPCSGASTRRSRW